MIVLEEVKSYGKNEGRNWCKKIRMDQSQSSRELAFPSSGIEEPRKKKSVVKWNTLQCMNVGLINEQFHYKHSSRCYTHTDTHTVQRWRGTRWPLQSRTVPQRRVSARTSRQDDTPQNSASQNNVTRVSAADAVATGNRRMDTHHSDGLGVDHDLRRDGGEVGQVCQDVNHRDDGHGDYDGQR